jgi:hypothetical protein
LQEPGIAKKDACPQDRARGSREELHTAKAIMALTMADEPVAYEVEE